MKRFLSWSVVLSALILVLGCNARVNRSIHIGDGEHVSGSQMSVNGSVSVGSDCEVRGSCRSVNGSVTVGDHSKVRGLQSVNGSIRVGEESKVDGSIESVNGNITCETGVQVRGDISSVNGHIKITNTRVRDDLETYNGHISLSDHSRVEGGITIREGKGNREQDRDIRIDIKDGSVVEGDVRVRGTHLQVTVYLSGGGEVQGDIKNARVVRDGE